MLSIHSLFLLSNMTNNKMRDETNKFVNNLSRLSWSWHMKPDMIITLEPMLRLFINHSTYLVQIHTRQLKKINWRCVACIAYIRRTPNERMRKITCRESSINWHVHSSTERGLKFGGLNRFCYFTLSPSGSVNFTFKAWGIRISSERYVGEPEQYRILHLPICTFTKQICIFAILRNTYMSIAQILESTWSLGNNPLNQLHPGLIFDRHFAKLCHQLETP
jgi:hypothetical protein